MHDAGAATKRVIVAWNMPRNWPQIQELLGALLQSCEQALTQHNPHWLGHCKALVEAGGNAAYGSITGADEPLSWRGGLRAPVNEATITLYCVVYGMHDAAVETALIEALGIHLPDAREAPAPSTQASMPVEFI
jgi:hypothetical protein